jgi:signal transduction histidine kinase
MEILALVRDEAKRRRVIIQTRLSDDLTPVAGDRVQLQQVVLNLLMNGMEAMSAVDERPREMVITTQNVDPGQVQFSVADSGPGLDPNMASGVFEPFYTTKPGGMGMGLSISRSILENHGGRIWAASNNGNGAIFYFTLPQYQEEGSHAEAAEV